MALYWDICTRKKLAEVIADNVKHLYTTMDVIVEHMWEYRE